MKADLALIVLLRRAVLAAELFHIIVLTGNAHSQGLNVLLALLQLSLCYKGRFSAK